MTVKRLIVNADELGCTAGINQGIFKAHREGIVTSATLMVSYPATREVPRLSAESPQLGIGLHVALTGGASALPPEPAEVLAEARAQLRRFRDIMGREPTHLDSHSHPTPAALEALVILSWETGLPVRAASAEMGERLRREGIKTTDHFVETFFGESVSEEALVRILEDVPVGTTELMCHPGAADDDRELQALTSPLLRQTLQATGVRLIHFGQL